MTKRSLSFPKGFVLIEVLVYIALIGFILIAVGTLATIANHARAKQVVEREVEDQGRQVLEEILQTVRNSSGIVLPASGVTGGTLSVAVDSALSSPTVFSLSGSTVQITEGSATAVSLTNSKVLATELSVQNLSRASTPGTVRVNFTLSGTITSGSAPFVYSKTFYGSASLR